MDADLGGTSHVERREVRYTGRVQGVGFRYTTKSIAERYRVTGYVRNRADGSVELVAEGEADELGRFLTDVEERMRENLRNVKVIRTDATAQFAGFEIRF